MVLPLEIIILPVIVAVVIVVPVVVVALLNRGKQLKCPNCGQAFKAPLMDEKMFGIGWTFPYMGNIRCPNCGTKGSRRAFSKTSQQTPAQQNP